MSNDINDKQDSPARLKSIKPFIEPGCISCGSCAFIAPEVFEVTDRSRVKVGADFEKNRELIEKAALKCPVQVIKIKGQHD